MARTTYANNRDFSHAGSSDKSLSSAPDVCKTPIGNSTPPIPYPVMSQAGDLGGGSSSVKVDGNSTALADSNHASCTGDEAGTAKGVGSGKVSDKTEFTTYSFDVKIEGKGSVRNLDMSTMNNCNTIGTVIGSNCAPTVIRVDQVDDIVADDVVLAHVVGIAGNTARTPSGTVVAKYEGSPDEDVITQDLSAAVNASGTSDETTDNRQVVLNNLVQNKRYQLLLEIAAGYRVPLSFEPSIAGGNEADVNVNEHSAHQTWLVPMLPRTHMDYSLSIKEDELDILASGYIYIFIGGRLWREIGIEEESDDSDDYTLYEINLDQDFGIDVRQNHFELLDETILIPQQVGSKLVNRIQIAYSRVQWSWKQILAYGGMHPDDPRVQGRDQLVGSPSVATKLRKDRLQNLGQLLPWRQQSNGGAYVAQNSDDPDRHLPKIVLHDPVGLALKNLATCTGALKDLLDEYTTLKKRPHHDAAETIYRVVSDPSLYKHKDQSLDVAVIRENICDAIPEKDSDGNKKFPSLNDYWDYLDEKFSPDRNLIQKKRDEYLQIQKVNRTVTFSSKYEKSDSRSDNIRKARKELDYTYLKKFLFPRSLRAKIEKLDEARHIYFRGLDNRHLKGFGTRYSDTLIPFAAAFSDFANLSAGDPKYNYMLMFDTWTVLVNPVHANKTTVCNLFNKNMDRSSPSLQDDKDIGKVWLNKILNEKEHALNKILFPSEEMNVANVYESADDLPDVELDGSGKFRPKDFAHAVSLLEPMPEEPEEGASKKSEGKDGKKESDSELPGLSPTLFGVNQKQANLTSKVVKDFFGWVNSSIDDVDGVKNPEIKRVRSRQFVSLGQASQMEGVRGLHVILSSKVDTSKYIILGVNEVREEHVKKYRGERKGEFKTETSDIPENTMIVDPRTKKVVSGSLISFDAYTAETLPKVGDKLKAREAFSASELKGKGIIVDIDVDVIVVSRKNKWAIKAAPVSKVVNGINNYGFPWVTIYFEIRSLEGLFLGGSASDKPLLEQMAIYCIAVGSVVHASAEATVAGLKVLNEVEAAKVIEKSHAYFIELKGKRIPITKLRALGGAISVGTTALAIIDTYESLRRHDHDAAVFSGLGALVGGVLAAQSLGFLALGGPVIWALMAAGLIAGLLAAHFKDKPLPDWAKHGPFGKKAFSWDYSAWENDPQACLRALLGLLLAPTVTLKREQDPCRKNSNVIVATMELPDFAVGRGDKFKILTSSQDVPLSPFRMHGPAINFDDYQEKLENHYKIEVHKSPDERVIHRIKFFYQDRPMTIWRSHVQVISRGVSLPCPYKPGLSSGSVSSGGGIISTHDPLWAHGDISAELMGKTLENI